ncbi:MAG TPA: carbohydrate kinase family protein [Mycobacteriales bacterium]|jgi:sugar/nucleoside kinase (ribokinase family)|nr:carbohydrate kinase family protein [Mycobacteriales bacterium]
MAFLAAGNLTIDDSTVAIGQCGGNALYTALGMWLWDEPTTLLAGIGTDFPAQWSDRLTAAGIDTSWVWSTGEPHALRSGPPDPAVWPLYSPSVQRLPPADFAGAHVAPGPVRQVADLVDALGYQTRVTTLDRPWWDGAGGLLTPALRTLAALVPGIDELVRQAREDDPWELAARLGADVPAVIVRQGPAGCLVLSRGARPTRVGTVPVSVVDPRGAGDAFCGGVCVGMALSGDPVRAAAYGAVAASYVIERSDPLTVFDADRGEARRRLAHVLGTVVEVSPA